MATTVAAERGTVYIEEPRVARWLFGSSQAAWIWLVVRLWLGWEWFQSGWGKIFGGDITWRFWDWGDAQYSITGDGNVGWIRSEGDVGVGDSVAGFATGAIESAEGPHPDVAYSWYVDFLEWVRDTAHPVIGLALIIGLFTGIAAFLGALLNFSFVFAGSAGVNPAMILASGVLILAWRNAGWWGLDRWVLPALGTPWHRGSLTQREGVEHAAEAEARAPAAEPPPERSGGGTTT
jgi:thiosulfate dehydrogenase [quinone] large subunit